MDIVGPFIKASPIQGGFHQQREMTLTEKDSIKPDANDQENPILLRPWEAYRDDNYAALYREGYYHNALRAYEEKRYDRRQQHS